MEVREIDEINTLFSWRTALREVEVALLARLDSHVGQGNVGCSGLQDLELDLSDE